MKTKVLNIGNRQQGRFRFGPVLNASNDLISISSAVEKIFSTLCSFMEPVLLQSSVALSAEIRDIDAGLSPKYGNIRYNLVGNP